VIATALAALVGWAIGSPTLVQVLPSYPPLYPNAALALAASGAAVWGLVHRSPRWVLNGAGVTLLLGGLSLVEYATGLDLQVDRLFFVGGVIRDIVPQAIPGRMAVSTAVCFVLTAVSLMLSLARSPRLRRAGSALTAAMVGAFGLITFV